MNRIFVINVKHIIFCLVATCALMSSYLIGNAIVNEVIEVAATKRLLPIYSVETEDKKVALTFDCAWGADDIPNIINTLAINNVKATFFTVGNWVKKYPEAINTLNEAGMEIR